MNVSKHTLSAYHSDLYIVAAGLANLSSDTAAGGLQTASADDLRKELESLKDKCTKGSSFYNAVWNRGWPGHEITSFDMSCEVVEGLKDHVPAPTGQAAVGDHLLALGDQLPDADTQTLTQMRRIPRSSPSIVMEASTRLASGGTNRGGQRRGAVAGGQRGVRRGEVRHAPGGGAAAG